MKQSKAVTKALNTLKEVHKTLQTGSTLRPPFASGFIAAISAFEALVEQYEQDENW